MSKINKAELKQQIAFWMPREILASKNGISLGVDIDMESGAFDWLVRESRDNGGWDETHFLGDRDDAIDYFLEVINAEK